MFFVFGVKLIEISKKLFSRYSSRSYVNCDVSHMLSSSDHTFCSMTLRQTNGWKSQLPPTEKGSFYSEAFLPPETNPTKNPLFLGFPKNSVKKKASQSTTHSPTLLLMGKMPFGPTNPSPCKREAAGRLVAFPYGSHGFGVASIIQLHCPAFTEVVWEKSTFLVVV